MVLKNCRLEYLFNIHFGLIAVPLQKDDKRVSLWIEECIDGQQNDAI